MKNYRNEKKLKNDQAMAAPDRSLLQYFKETLKEEHRFLEQQPKIECMSRIGKTKLKNIKLSILTKNNNIFKIMMTILIIIQRNENGNIRDYNYNNGNDKTRNLSIRDRYI